MALEGEKTAAAAAYLFKVHPVTASRLRARAGSKPLYVT